MKQRGTIDVTVRPKRQITIPREICEELGIGPGDRLELVLNGSMLIAKPKKTIALEALREIREAFQRSGITEEELQEAGRQLRHKFDGDHHATKA
jgi:AbrB family looped-hinge helix DNA binding protein